MPARPGPHYLLGYAATAIGIGHSFLSLSRASLPAPAVAGLWLASLAALLLVAQALVGRALRAAARKRDRYRRIHLVLTGALLVLIALHAALNGP
jgi:threonine/homoserine/homoserine lactone efflux protein